MPPIAKEETEKKPDSKLSRLDESLAQYHEDIEACEELAFRTKEFEDLSVAELNMFRQAGFIERFEIIKFVARCQIAKGHISKAGPKAAFEEEKQKLLSAEAAEKEQKPLVEEKIREMQDQLRKLKSEIVGLRSSVDRKMHERKKLIDLVPPAFVEEAAHLKRAANLRYLQEISDLETQLKITDLVQTKGPKDDWSISHAQSFGIDPSEWSAYGQILQGKRGKIEARLAELKPEYEKALEEAEAPLYYYHRKFGL